MRLPDELERQLRLLALSGELKGRKGSLNEVLLDAVAQYVARDPLKNLMETVRDKKATRGTRSKALRAIHNEGRAGLVGLTELGSDGGLENWVREGALALASGEEDERKEGEKAQERALERARLDAERAERLRLAEDIRTGRKRAI